MRNSSQFVTPDDLKLHFLGDPVSAAHRNHIVIERLQRALRDAFKDAIPAKSDYALLDFPNHANIGDSAIYVGEMILCHEHFKRKPLLVTEARQTDLDQIARLDPTVTLLLHGGGNLGDLYPRHQHFREKVLERFPDRRVVLLPQSIHFVERAAIQQAAAAFNAHPNFTLMVRDKASLAFAQEHFTCHTMMVPDMAFMIGALPPTQTADLKVLGLIREDKETVLNDKSALESLPRPSAILDWPKEIKRHSRLNRLPQPIRRYFPARFQGYNPVTPSGYERLAGLRLQCGLQILSRGEIVVTDRLHAHILSVLLGKPNITLDNNYRKIANFSEAWTSDSSSLPAESIEEAIKIINSFN